MCGALMPGNMLADLDPIAENPDLVTQYGIDWSTRQCRELLTAKVDGLHFYTLNKSKATRQIVENLRCDGALK